MAKGVNSNVIDAALNVIKTGITGYGPCNKQVVCSAEPTTYTEANATYMLANVAMTGTDFTLSTASGTGMQSNRKVNTGAKSSVSVTNSGTATHVALIDSVNSVLLLVTTCTSQALTAGNTVNIPTWNDTINAPT